MSSFCKADLFRRLPDSVSSIELPDEFTFPFNYEPHPLCILAAENLQQSIDSYPDWNHDFGLDGNSEVAIGKMFGVLIVKSGDEIGYLAGYSGKIGNRNDHPGFVPPVVDLLDVNGFYRKGEAEISGITKRIEVLESDLEYISESISARNRINELSSILSSMRKNLKVQKKRRAKIREKAKQNSSDNYHKLYEDLKNQSLELQFEYKKKRAEIETEIENLQNSLDNYQKKVEDLKFQRKEKSSQLQTEIFTKFQFLNYNGKTKSLLEIFDEAFNKLPPGGAGECAGPKLLNYAYQHQMKPLAMAEFWWGISPKSKIRRHKYFYPSCRGKCEPIMKHMLEGLRVEADPMLSGHADVQEIEFIYEDESIVVINKPSGLLSIPGKKVTDSVLTRIKRISNQYTGPVIVHRLDMSTSGIMILAKNEDAYKHLQKQFLSKTLVKRYVAILQQNIDKTEGTINLPIRVDLDNRPQQLVDFEHGKAAITRWKCFERTNNLPRVHFFPITGRTHQLRVHAAHCLGLNSPILGDDIYGRRDKRLYLHADYIKFEHPDTGVKISFLCRPDF